MQTRPPQLALCLLYLLFIHCLISQVNCVYDVTTASCLLAQKLAMLFHQAHADIYAAEK